MNNSITLDKTFDIREMDRSMEHTYLGINELDMTKKTQPKEKIKKRD